MESLEKSIPYVHWEFYLDIESDLLRTAKYVDFCEDHRKVYSVAFARTLISASAEFEVVCKAVCETIKLSKKLPAQCKIHHLRDAMSIWDKDFQVAAVRTKSGRFIVRPFSGWFPDGQLSWWKAYNDVKHARHEKYLNGNLENALYSAAALFLMNVVLANRHGNIDLKPRSRLFLPILPGNHDPRYSILNPYRWDPIGSRKTDELNERIFEPIDPSSA